MCVGGRGLNYGSHAQCITVWYMHWMKIKIRMCKLKKKLDINIISIKNANSCIVDGVSSTKKNSCFKLMNNEKPELFPANSLIILRT